MKNIALRFLLFFGFVALLLSCTSNKFVVDENNQSGKNATLDFSNQIQVKYWDGINISERLYKGKKAESLEKSTLIVPSGNKAAIVDAHFMVQVKRYGPKFEKWFVYNDVKLEYNFEAGKKYQLKTRNREITNLTIVRQLYFEFYIDLYEGNRRLKEWKVGDEAISSF